MSITVQEVIDILQEYPDKEAEVFVYEGNHDTFEIGSIDDSMDHRVDFNLADEFEFPEPTFNEHETNNLMFAMAALQEGLEVWVTHPHLFSEPMQRLHSLAEIVDCEGRLFVIKKENRKTNLLKDREEAA